MCPTNERPSKGRAELDEVFRALSHTARRRILTAVMEDNPRRQGEFETVAFSASDADEEAVTIELRHRHLPHLDEAGFVDWDRDAGRISRGEDFESIRPLLELIDDHREELPDDWP